MTLKELHERIGWQLEGRLQWKDFDEQWRSLESEHSTPGISDDAASYRRRPDQPPMPGEVWVAPSTAERHMGVYREKCADGQVRYVRAAGIIDGARLEMRFKREEGATAWVDVAGCEYRFKP